MLLFETQLAAFLGISKKCEIKVDNATAIFFKSSLLPLMTFLKNLKQYYQF